MTTPQFHVGQLVHWRGKKATIWNLPETHVEIELEDGKVQDVQAADLSLIPLEESEDHLLLNLRATRLSGMIATVFNHAGGAGKTSLVKNVGHELTRHGYRVLLIDLDPQANLTTWMGVYDARLEDTVLLTIAERGPLPEPRRVHDLDLIPSHVNLAGLERSSRSGSNLRLRNTLTTPESRARWDVVLIDSPPSLGKIAEAGALAADAFIVPVQTRLKGVEAINGLTVAVEDYRETRPDLYVAAWVPTMYGRTRKDDARYLADIRAAVAPCLTAIPERAADWFRADELGQPVTLAVPNSPAALDVQQVTRDLIEALSLAPVQADQQ